MKKEIEELKKQIEELKARIAQLEARPIFVPMPMPYPIAPSLPVFIPYSPPIYPYITC